MKVNESLNPKHAFGLVCLMWFVLGSCVRVPHPYEGLAPGPWRGQLFINQFQDLIVTEGRKKVVKRDVDFELRSTAVPFQFEINTSPDGKQTMTIYNGVEQMVFTDVRTGRNVNTGDDTFYVQLTPYDACLKGIFEANKMQGHWFVLDKPGYAMPFEARYGQNHRFRKAVQSDRILPIEGTYQAVFSTDSSDAYDAVGEFKQQEDRISGTFRTETGDYRFLDGQVIDDELFLSCFDGAHAFLFTAKILGDSMNGLFYSGIHYKTNWIAKKVITGILRDPDSISTVIRKDAFAFGFETPEGKLIDFREPPYKGKNKLVQIMGSWCPNCLDEARFLKQNHQSLLKDSIIVIGLSFERHKEKDKAMQRIREYRDKLELPYEVAWGGLANRDSASRVIPQISKIMAYPSLLYINEKNEIVKVHTGFDGPATSKFEEYSKVFWQNIQWLKQ